MSAFADVIVPFYAKAAYARYWLRVRQLERFRRQARRWLLRGAGDRQAAAALRVLPGGA